MRKPDGSTRDSTDAPGVGDFLSRWSRRKRRARDAAAAEAPPARAREGVQSSTSEPARQPPVEPERVLTDEDTPALEGLGEDGDYSAFMSSGVSEALRRRALRQLFLSPKFNVVDGLDDYAEDFTTFEALGDIVTADMRHQLELEAERRKERLEQQAQAVLEDADDSEPEAAAPQEQSAGAATAADAAKADAEDEQQRGAG